MLPRFFVPAFAVLWLCCAAASSQTFDPADYGAVTLHLKADALSLANNAPVGSWGPLTASGGAQPAYIASDPRFNNKPVVRFDGVSKVMTWSSADLNARTIFVVTTLESAASSLAGLISNGADGLNVRRHNTTSFYRSPGQGMDNNDFVGNGSPTGTLSINNVPSGAYTAGAPHLVIAVAGAQKNYSTFWLGRPNSSLARWWNGSVAEVLIYDGVLTASDRNAVGYYLQTKYNLPTNFTTPNPVVQRFSATTASGVTSEGGVLSTSGAPVTLEWVAQNAATVSINQGVLASSSNVAGQVQVAPSATTTYTLTAANAAGASTTRTVTVHIGVTPAPPRIAEFMAENDSGLTDADGDRPDWIELHNPNPYGIDLQGCRLRDGGNQWDFPAGSGIPANGYRYVFASGKDRRNPAEALHTNFSLQNSGEYLALIRIADGAVLSEFAPRFPPQYADISYGSWGSPPQLGYFEIPTPGAPNTDGVAGFLNKTDAVQFSTGRGFYSAAVTTVISAKTPGATIIYTTNGSTPSETNGARVEPPGPGAPPEATVTIHPGSVPIGATGINVASVGGVAMVRAAAFLDGHAPTEIETHSYIFPTRVLSQTSNDAIARGWPSAPVNGQLFDYGMDPNVTTSFPPAQMIESLQTIPTLSIVTDIKNFVDPAIGLYVNADQHGGAWERPISVELIHPPGYVSPDGNADGFQIDAGLRMRGGFSRNDQFFKHSFRLFFSKKYAGKLRYPLFGAEGVDQFAKLDLGTGSNYAWYRESNYNNGRFNTMCRDPFARDTQGALGQPYTKSRYYHLYLNGHYWGLFYSEERAVADFGASYMGGDESEYDAVKCSNHIGNFATEATDGDLNAWRSLWDKTRAIGTTDASPARYYEIQGRNPDGTRNPSLPVLLDVDNLIDEMLVIFYCGDGDAVLSRFLGHDRPNNWFSVRRRGGEHGFRFFIRDAEHTLGAPNWVVDQTGPFGGQYINDFTYSNPQRMHQDLMASAEYRLRFADHVRRHFFNNGALTPERCIARFQARADQVERGMKAESARWGDAQAISNLPAGHPPRYVVADFTAAVDYVKNTIMPTRTQTVLNQLVADGLYPSLTAPSFSDGAGAAHYGGNVPTGFQLRVTALAGAIYYTLDGADPRLPGGGIAPGALTGSSPVQLTLGSTVTVKARSYNSATQAWSALTQAQYLVGPLGGPANLVISKIHYNPPGATDLEEFIEIMNIGGSAVDLTNCRFAAGIEYAFPDAYLLGAGERCLIVRDRAAFQAAYPSVPAAKIAGEFAVSALDNAGERLRLIAADGGVIKDFSYGNSSPWPPTANGAGSALVLIRPATNPDHALAANWRASAVPGGVPGESDSLGYSQWAATHGVTDPDGADDGDADGLPELLEYGLGTNPTLPTPEPWITAIQQLTVSAVAADYLTLTFTRPLGRDDAALVVEASSDLNGAWSEAVLVSRSVSVTDGMETVTYRHPAARPGAAGQFLRIKVTRLF